MYLSNYGLGKKAEKDILKLDYSFKYWSDMLFEKCMRIFTWAGLPFPQKEIESRLLIDGYCGFLKDSKVGLMVASGGMSGVTHYYDEFTTFNWSTVGVANTKSRAIGKDCVIINNNQLRNPILPMVLRYASLLAHADISLKCALINTRETNTYASSDENTAENINRYYDKLYNGDSASILDESLIESVKNISNRESTTAIKDCLSARTDLLSNFFKEIGVKSANDKKERMIESEVDSNNQLLLFNISDMLAERKKACEEINKIFGTNITVELSEEFKELQGGARDENM